MKEQIINAIGCLIARWIIGSFQNGFIVKRKAGAEQIITVFSMQAYRNVIKPKITGIEPEFICESLFDGEISARCKCGGMVHSYQNYCSECGSKLIWRNMHEYRE